MPFDNNRVLPTIPGRGVRGCAVERRIIDLRSTSSRDSSPAIKTLRSVVHSRILIIIERRWRGVSMSSIPSGGGGHGARHHNVSEFLAPAAASTGLHSKRKRRPAGTPDPGAEVVALSPKTLMESDRYVCEICNQGFQRDQNLQMHRRRHKVPWKLLKKPSLGTHKRVYVCPERSCLHHNPAHALGDLVGIKKHYRRKHCTEKQWECDKCSKRYAVQSDFKAHLKTCGTRGHCCDCGRVFSRVESFIEHQDTCSAVKHKSMQQSGGAASERKLQVYQYVNSRDSPSQSSNTTQAMTFAQSGMSDTATNATQVLPTADDVVDHSRRITATTASAYNAAAAIPPWLMDRRGTELELLQPRRVSSDVPNIDSSTSTPLEDLNTPSLKLSIGPYAVDTKPSLSSIENEALALAFQRSCSSVYSSGEAHVPRGTSSRAHDLVLSIRNQVMDEPGADHAVNSLSAFLVQAARRIGPASDLQFKKLQTLSGNSEVPANGNLHAVGTHGSKSECHEGRARNIHDSESLGMGVTRRGTSPHHSRLEPASSSVSSRQAIDLMDPAAETDQLCAASRGHEAIRTQSTQRAAARVEAANELCEQAPTQWEIQISEAQLAKAQAQLRSTATQDHGLWVCHWCNAAIPARSQDINMVPNTVDQGPTDLFAGEKLLPTGIHSTSHLSKLAIARELDQRRVKDFDLN